MNALRTVFSLASVCFVALSAAHAAGNSSDIEKIEAKNAEAIAENELITQVLEAQKANKWEDVATLSDQLIAKNPENWEYRRARANAALSLGKYDDAVTMYQTAIDKVPAELPKRDTALGQILTNQGNSYLKLKKTAEAMACYSKAAKLDPNPATAYFNLCATQYNTGNVKGVLEACDQAIKADPKKADAYFIKGSVMLGDATTDANGKLVAPPGTEAALKKYLELAPNGSHAKDVQEMLEAIGVKIETTYEKSKR